MTGNKGFNNSKLALKDTRRETLLSEIWFVKWEI